MKRRTEAEWEQLIQSAIQSGQTIGTWCQEQGIDKKTFYSHCKGMGYIKKGKRTEKWAAGSTACRNTGRKDTGMEAPGRQALVPVPKQIIRAAANGISGSRPAVLPTAPQENIFPSVCIQKDAWKVFVGDGFRKETLQSVLEVIANAQGS